MQKFFKVRRDEKKMARRERDLNTLSDVDAISRLRSYLQHEPGNESYKNLLYERLKRCTKPMVVALTDQNEPSARVRILTEVIKSYEEMYALCPANMARHQKLANFRSALYLIQSATIAETPYPLNVLPILNIVFQGGGIKGLAYKGAYEILARYFIDVRRLKRIAGTSAGALTALPIALGYKVDELDSLIDIDFTKFFDGDCTDAFLALVAEQEKIEAKLRNASGNVKKAVNPSAPCKATTACGELIESIKDISKIVAMIKKINNPKMGLFKGDYFRERWAEKVIQQKTKVPYLTFLELHELSVKDSDNYKDLFVVGTNLIKKQPVLMSWKTTPHAIISDALRITISIPAVFEPHKLYMKNPQGERVPYLDDHPRNPGIQSDDLFVDGGVVMNYALRLFDYECYLDDNIDGMDLGNVRENPFTLGFRLVDKNNPQRADAPEGLLGLLQRVAEIGFSLADCDHDLNSACKRTIYIDHMGISAVKFNLDPAEKAQLIDNGRIAVQDKLPAMLDEFNEKNAENVFNP